MEKTVFMFPGVGSQRPGMGRDFYQQFKVARSTFEEASDVLGEDMVKRCLDPAEKKTLEKLESSQTALLTVSTATYRVYMQEIGKAPHYCLGHSLGEYSALCSSGALLFKDALHVVKERGKILSEAAATMAGIMAWVINLDFHTVKKLVEENHGQGPKVFISAYDSPSQSSLSGPREEVIKIGRKLEKQGAIVYPLKLSGPFHCPLMAEPAEKIKSVLQNVTCYPLRYPVLANRNAALYTRETIMDNLSLQLSHPIRWHASIQYLLKQGVTRAIEMGPDKVLKHLMKNNTTAIHTYSLENVNDLKTLKKDFYV
jgi:[acyl-carrier-protein] S-malonyltransferase